MNFWCHYSATFTVFKGTCYHILISHHNTCSKPYDYIKPSHLSTKLTSLLGSEVHPRLVRLSEWKISTKQRKGKKSLLCHAGLSLIDIFLFDRTVSWPVRNTAAHFKKHRNIVHMCFTLWLKQYCVLHRIIQRCSWFSTLIHPISQVFSYLAVIRAFSEIVLLSKYTNIFEEFSGLH